MAPAVGILHLAELDAGEMAVQLCAHRPHSPVLAEAVRCRNGRLFQDRFYVDAGDGRQDNGGAAGADFLAFSQFRQRNVAFLHLQAQVGGRHLQALVRDGR